MVRWSLIALLQVWLAWGATVAERIEAAAREQAVGRRGTWGMKVVDLTGGATVYERNAQAFFVPASNAKLFTTALALVRLGPEHRFETAVEADEGPDEEGRVRGELRLVGGGDPTLSARAVPYQKGPIRGNPLAAIEELAEQVVARGVRRVGGGVVGDDSAYVWDPYPPGWSQNDTLWEYGAPVSALTLNDSAIKLTVRPGAEAGAPGRLLLSPAMEYFVVHNRVRTAAGGEAKVQVERQPGSRQLQVWGRIPLGANGVTHLLAVDDPAEFAAEALREALTRRGVAVRGGVRARHRHALEVADLKKGEPARPRSGVVLAKRISPPLVETLKILNKVSQNLHTELTLREVGRVRRQVGSREAGLEELREFLAEAGIAKQDYRFEDGSGLSRLTLVTPAAVIRLLEHMHTGAHREAWVDLMPIGGEDGTLEDRFKGVAEARPIRAKTGTISHVGALSGYAEGAGGRRLAFSILVNNYNGETSEIRRFIDRIVATLLE